MTYPTKLLNDGEHVVVSTRTHAKALIGPALVLVVLVVAVVLLSQVTDSTVVGAVAGAVAVGVVVWWVLRPLVEWLTTTYTFTNRRFIKRSGLVAKEGRTIPLNRISGVDFEIGVVDRMFGCGTLIVSDASTDGRVLISDIPRVEEVQLRVAEELHKLRPATAPTMAREPRRRVSAASDKGTASESVAERLDLAVLGQSPTMTASEVAAETGVTIDQARRLWRALGFPEMGNEHAFSRADADAVGALMGIVDAGAIEFDMAVNMTRGLGQTMSRLADWEVATLAGRVEELEAGDQATGSRVESALRLIEQLSGPFEEMLLYVWRRHLAASVARMEAMGAAHEDLHTVDVTVGFADLVSFTALSNAMDREQIGDLVEKFEGRCHDVVSVHGGRIIKSLGDSVLFVIADPVAAVAVADGIINVIGRDPRLPDVRVGLASGPVIPRLGDVFGPPVNLAARLTAVARRNRLIIDQSTADLLPAEDFETRRLPARPVRGFGLVEPVAVRRR